MVRFIVTLVVSVLIVASIMFFVYDNDYTSMRAVSEAFFYVGLPMFFISLITLTNASTIFISMGYTVKNIFTRHRQKFGDYYEYQKERRENSDSVALFGIGALLISVVFLAIAFYYGYASIA